MIIKSYTNLEKIIEYQDEYILIRDHLLEFEPRNSGNYYKYCTNYYASTEEIYKLLTKTYDDLFLIIYKNEHDPMNVKEPVDSDIIYKIKESFDGLFKINAFHGNDETINFIDNIRNKVSDIELNKYRSDNYISSSGSESEFETISYEDCVSSDTPESIQKSIQESIQESIEESIEVDQEENQEENKEEIQEEIKEENQEENKEEIQEENQEEIQEADEIKKIKQIGTLGILKDCFMKTYGNLLGCLFHYKNACYKCDGVDIREESEIEETHV